MEKIKSEILALTSSIKEKLQNNNLEYLNDLLTIKEKIKQIPDSEAQRKIEQKFVGLEKTLNEKHAQEGNLENFEGINKLVDLVIIFETSVNKNMEKLIEEEKDIYDTIASSLDDLSNAIISFDKLYNNEEVYYGDLSTYIKIINAQIKEIEDETIKKEIAQDYENVFRNVSEKSESTTPLEEDLNEMAKQYRELKEKVLKYKENKSYELKEENDLKKIFVTLKKAILKRDRIMFGIGCTNFALYLKSFSENKNNEIKEIYIPMLKKIDALDKKGKDFRSYTDEEIAELLRDVNELEKKAYAKEKTEEEIIREQMAEILYNDKTKAFEGIEHESDINPNFDKLSEEDKKAFIELRKKLNPSLDNPSEPEQYPIVPVENQPKKERRVVKAFKSAKNFLKKHKKALLIAGGIALLTVGISALLPSVMAINSNLWWAAVNAGANPSVGLPVVLHDINLIIGKAIGATFTSGTGVWTLANGATLGAGAILSGALATLGKVALIGGVGAGATVGVKNAYKKAKEKIQKIKEKINEKTNGKSAKELASDIKVKYKEKVGEIKTNIKNKYQEKVEKFQNKLKSKIIMPTKEKGFYREDLDPKLITMINALKDKEILTEEEVEDFKYITEVEIAKTLKEKISNTIHRSKDDDAKVTYIERGHEIMDAFIKAAHRQNYYSDEDIELINKTDLTTLTEHIFSDAKYQEFEEKYMEFIITKEQKEKEGKTK